MKKIFVRIAIVVAVILIVGLVVVFFSLNAIVKKGVETVGPQLTKVEMRLGSAQLSPFSGSGRLRQLFVGNPEGYKTPSAIQVGDIKVAVQLSSLLSDTIVVEEINIQSPEITLEGSLSGNNLSKILENLEAASGGGKTESAEKPPAGGGKKFFVKDLVVNGGKIHLSNTSLGGKAMTVPLPPVHLQNIGTKDKGVTAAELSKQILDKVLASAKTAATGAVADIGKGVKAVGAEAGQQVEKVTTGLKGLFKGSSGSKTN